MSESAPGIPHRTQDQPADDILELDSPHRHRTYGRLGLMVLGSSVVLFVTSLLLVTTVANGNLLDLVVLVLWLASAALAICGLGLIAVAGVTALTRRSTYGNPVETALGPNDARPSQ
jgi:hypothetical protein